MDITTRLRQMVSKPVAEFFTYECWLCGDGYNNPAAFLWHINGHKMEMKSRSVILIEVSKKNLGL
jgi:hypothetical protein